MMVVGTYRDAEVEDGSTLAQVMLDMKRSGTFERVMLARARRRLRPRSC